MDRFIRALTPDRPKATSTRDPPRPSARRLFQSDPFAAAVAPPFDEPVTTRKARQRAEAEARRISSAIDERLRKEHVEAAVRRARGRAPITARLHAVHANVFRPHVAPDLEMPASDADTLDPVRRPRAHFEEITGYLELDLATEPAKYRARSRHKLSMLIRVKFEELSTDVYDELQRRRGNLEGNGPFVPHLPYRDEYHPKRLSHRHSLSSLGESAFADLASDVCYELLRRFPEIEPQTAEYLFNEPVSGDDNWRSPPSLRASRRSIYSSLPSLSFASATKSSLSLASTLLMSRGPSVLDSSANKDAPKQSFPSHIRDIIKGYTVDPDRDFFDDDDGLPFAQDVSPVLDVPAEPPQNSDAELIVVEDFPADDGVGARSESRPSLLPQSYIINTVSHTTSTVSSLGSSMFDTLTYYKELREARADSDFEAILKRLWSEWLAAGASLATIAGFSFSVFGYTPDTVFGIKGFAKGAVALSSVTAGIGICVDAWFLATYSSANAHKFKALATDVYSSFFFFSLASRLPVLMLLCTSVAVMLLLFAIAWSNWGDVVVVSSVFALTVYYLQYIVLAVHCALRAAGWAARAALWVCRTVVHAEVGSVPLQLYAWLVGAHMW